MKYLTTGVLSLLVAVCVLAAVAWSQPGGFQGMHGGRGGGPGRGASQGERPGHPPTANLVIEALDSDGDSEISASEMKNATASLAKLDKNGDNKLTTDEIMPSGPPMFGGPGRGEFGGPQRGGSERRGGPNQDGRPAHAGFGGPGGGGPGMHGHGPIEQLMELDTDKDGKVTKAELLAGVQRIFEKGDLDKDGAIDEEEAEKLVQEFAPPHGVPGGHNEAGDADRPQRPE